MNPFSENYAPALPAMETETGKRANYSLFVTGVSLIKGIRLITPNA
jgi:hypothetical protein